MSKIEKFSIKSKKGKGKSPAATVPPKKAPDKVAPVEPDTAPKKES